MCIAACVGGIQGSRVWINERFVPFVAFEQLVLRTEMELGRGGGACIDFSQCRGRHVCLWHTVS